MVFSERVELICREYNQVHAHKHMKGLKARELETAVATELAINFCLGTLGIPCVRDTGGYITGFEIMGAIHEVRS